MSLESIDFQAIVHQQITNLMDSWRAEGFLEDQIQDTANQFFNMGLIAAQQIQQEGGVQPEGVNQMIAYTPESAERIIFYFLQGLNAAVIKSHEQRLPAQETWQFMQNVAYHVFEQSKQAIVATLGQEHTPDVQIPQEQIINWLSQTAVEALIYYVGEHEKQHGPITRTDEQVMPDLLSQPEPEPEPLVPQMPAEMEPEPEPVYEEPAAAMEAPEPEPVVAEAPAPMPAPAPAANQGISEIHHKYAAVGLLLSNLSNRKQQQILAAFGPEEQQIIHQFRDPEVMAQYLDLGLVAKYLRLFKDKMGQPKAPIKSPYASSMALVLQNLPEHRLERLFQNERPFVKGYITQFLQQSGKRSLNPYHLPPGVEESLVLYLQRNFPDEVVAS